MNAQTRRPPLTDQGEQLYRHILRSEPSALDVHADQLGWTLRGAERAVRGLEKMGLVRRTPDGQVRADDPRASVGRLLATEEALLDDRRQELLALRESLESFEFDYRRGLQLSGPRLPAWEQLGAAEAPSVVEHLFRTSEGPVVQVVVQVATGPGQAERIRRYWESVAASGRTLRTIFPMSVLVHPEWHAFAARRAEAGEQQRYLADDALRVEFGVFGRAGVLVAEGQGMEADFHVLRPPVVVSAFRDLFEQLWRRAEPLVTKEASEEDVKILELLAMGFKDEAIARQMGLGLRTVRRRIAHLMEEHGAETRFQLGLAVARRGLVG